MEPDKYIVLRYGVDEGSRPTRSPASPVGLGLDFAQLVPSAWMGQTGPSSTVPFCRFPHRCAKGWYCTYRCSRSTENLPRLCEHFPPLRPQLPLSSLLPLAKCLPFRSLLDENLHLCKEPNLVLIFRRAKQAFNCNQLGMC